MEGFPKLDFIQRERSGKLDRIYDRSERSLYAQGLLTTGLAGQEICSLKGFNTWQQGDIYRLDYQVRYTNEGTDQNVELRIGNSKYRLPVCSVLGTVCQGTFFVAPDNMDISLNMVATDADGKIVQGSLTLSRLSQGFRIE